MATILAHSRVCDGYDYLVQSATGPLRLFHFVELPDNPQAAVDAMEAELLEASEPLYIVIGEDGAVID